MELRDRQPDGSVPAAPLIRLLDDLAAVVSRIDDFHYRAELAPEVSGSIGGHVRHCLDHVAALLGGAENGHVEYESRLRGTAVDTSRDTALTHIRRLTGQLGEIASHELANPVTLVTTLASKGQPLSVQSTVGRELAFVLNHTIHHMAIIAVLLRDRGVAVPPPFGYAPTTPIRNPAA